MRPFFLFLFGVVAWLPALAAGAAPASPVSRNVQLIRHLNNYTRYSACWSYVHHDGREYAVLGTEFGTSIVNLSTVPSMPYEVAFIPGLQSIWREMKQYRTYVYVSTEAAGGGIQIIDMADPDHPVLVKTYVGTFNRAHTVAVDTTRALLYCNGTRLDGAPAGMRILSLGDPRNPVELAAYFTDYVHDSWARGTRLYAFCISTGTVRILDTTVPAETFEVLGWVYPDSKSHSGEASKDGRYLYVCDEINYSKLKIFDMQDIFTHPMIYETTVNPLAIVHNVHVKQDTAFVAWYTEGVRLFDVTDPTLPAQWGYYDTYPGFSGGFHGVWEVAPFFPSGTFIASDIETGLYVFRATPDYGILKVRVRDATSNPLAGVDVVRSGFPDDSARTQTAGAVRLALPPGASTLRVSKFGYVDRYIAVNVTKGSQDSAVVTLDLAPSSILTGMVRASSTLAAIPDAKLELEGTPVTGTTSPAGSYSITGVPDGLYTVTCYRAGYGLQKKIVPVQSSVPRSGDWRLLPAAWYDSSDTDKGWSLSQPDDNATTAGRWARAVPNGTSGLNAPVIPRGAQAAPQHDEPSEGFLPTGPIAPSEDATPGGSGACFVTGNGPPGAFPGDYDVDLGKTTLTSPPLNLAGMVEPTLTWQRWFHMNTPGEPDSFLIQISNDGASWINVLTLRESHAHWHHDLVRVRDFVTPTAAVRIRFIAQDEGPPEGTVEAAVDDVQAYDAALLPSGTVEPPADAAPRAVLEAPRPNPAAGTAFITLRLGRGGHASVSVYDVAGRRVVTLFDGEAPAGPLALAWNGMDARSREVGSGIYWIRSQADGVTDSRRLVRLR